MKNKIFEYFFTLSNVLLFLGVVITSILIIKEAQKYESTPPSGFAIPATFYIPYMIFALISLTLLIVFAILKENYFKLIRMHISHKYIFIHYVSLVLVGITILTATLMLGFAPTLDVKFISNTYLFITIAIVAILSLIPTGLNSYSKLKIKVELAIRRTKGVQEENSSTSNDVAESK